MASPGLSSVSLTCSADDGLVDSMLNSKNWYGVSCSSIDAGRLRLSATDKQHTCEFIDAAVHLFG